MRSTSTWPAPMSTFSRVSSKSRSRRRPCPAPISIFNSSGTSLLKRRFQSLRETAEVRAVVILGDRELADAGIDVIVDLRSGIGIAKAEIRFQQMARATANGQLAGGGFHRNVHGLGVLTIDGAAFVMHQRNNHGDSLEKRPTVPEQHYENANEGHDSDRHSDRRAGRPAGILPRAHGIQHLPHADEDEDQRPVGFENEPGIEGWPIVRVEETGRPPR